MKTQIRRLIATALALRAGTNHYFPITRLTSLKSLCKEPGIAARFVYYVAEPTRERMQASARPEYTGSTDWARYQTRVSEAVATMRDHVETPTEQNRAGLRSLVRKAEAEQRYTGEWMWGRPLRRIYSTDLLVIEDALRCMAEPLAAPYWAYQTAKDYAECYNPRYGTGLIPESLPMLDDFIYFWIGRDQSPTGV